MNRKNLLVICFLLFTAVSLKAQDSYQPGFAILNDGTRVSGLISLYEKAPWYNQRFIYLKDSATVAANPGKDVKSKKYVADDLKYYKVGDRTFTKIHYVDLENLQAKSLGSNDHMLEVLALGRIKAYRFYAYPQDVYVTFGTEDDVKKQIQNNTDDLLSHWKMLTQKDDEKKYRDAFDYDLQKLFGDTPEIWEKYKKGGYGNEPISEKKGFAAKMMNMAKKATYSHMQWESLVAAISEYNSKNTAGK